MVKANSVEIVTEIKRITKRWNKDNISRTVFYNNFFNKHPEIKWAFLASVVSRNAGWSMTDLKGEWFPRILDEEQIRNLFLTYERANWTIFEDAVPQLLLYAKSKVLNESLFHYGIIFGVSKFMLREWEVFLESGNENRLLTALIINEQYVIEEPVMHHHFYAKKVFRSMVFKIQDWFHFSTVLLPTLDGKLYGLSVSGFQHIQNRIKLGKKLALLLFHNELFGSFKHFTEATCVTGSRYEYEQYMGKRREGPIFRAVYPIIKHHQREKKEWYEEQRSVQRMLIAPVSLPHQLDLTNWYEGKRSQIRTAIEIENLFKQKRREKALRLR